MKKPDGTYVLGTVNGQNITFADFTLKDGENVTFVSKNDGTGVDVLPVGTTYTFTETGVTRYKAKAAVVTNAGTAQQVTETATGADLTIDATSTSNYNVLGVDTNSTAVTNTLQDVTPTGIIVENLPYILLIGGALAGLIAYAMLRRRRRQQVIR